MKVKVSDIVVPESRLSAKFTPDQEAFFKASVEKLGVIHEPVVRRIGLDKYELIAGAHRLHELMSQGIQEVEVKVVEADEHIALEMNLIENVARGDYDPIQLSEQLNRYLTLGASTEDIVRLTGHTLEWVRFYLALSNLPDKYKEAVSQGILKVGHIDVASALPNSEEMAHALDLSIDLKWPVVTLEHYVKRRLDDLRLARALEEGVSPPPTPTPAEARAMVETYECSGCRRAVHRRTITCPPICDQCYTLLRYCTDQFGEPRQAMGYIYESVRHYQAFLEGQQRYLLAQQQAHVFQAQPPTGFEPASGTLQPQQTQFGPTPPPGKLPETPAPYPEKSVAVQDERLRAAIKKVVKEMLESHGK